MMALPEIVDAAVTAVRPLWSKYPPALRRGRDLPPCTTTARASVVILSLLNNAGRFTGAAGVTLRVWHRRVTHTSL